MAENKLSKPDNPDVPAPETELEQVTDDAPKSNAGAPTKYGAEVVQKIVAAIQRQMSVAEACHYAGIGTSTYYNWLDEYPEFLDKIEQAKTYLFRKSKEIIADDITAGKNVTTAKWLLEKKDPEFNPKQKLELSGDIEVNKEEATLVDILERMKGNSGTDTATTDSGAETPAE